MAGKATPTGTSLIGERQPALEALLSSRGITYTFIREYPVADIEEKWSEGDQVRLHGELAPSANVDRYSTVMRSGGVFPAAVIDHDGKLLDGNTRFRAKQKARQPFMAVYQLGPISDDVKRLLAIELNQINGQAMSLKAIRTQVEAYSVANPEAPLSSEVWQRRTGVQARKINEWLRVLSFDDEAEAAGVPTVVLADAKFSDTAKLALLKLGSNRLRKEAIELTAQAGLQVREVRDLVRDVQVAAKDSEEKALGVLTDRRAELADHIASGGALSVRPSKMSKHRMHLAYIAENIDPADITSVRETDRDDVLELLSTVIGVVTEMRARLEGAGTD